jgi:hypothetical protein
MTVRVKFSMGDRDINEEVTAPDADTMLAMAKDRVAKELGWKGMFLRAMSPLQFAQLAVSKYNEHFGTNYATPTSGDDFLKFGQETGNVEMVAP